jgi:hypothetical protein
MKRKPSKIPQIIFLISIIVLIVCSADECSSPSMKVLIHNGSDVPVSASVDVDSESIVIPSGESQSFSISEPKFTARVKPAGDWLSSAKHQAGVLTNDVLVISEKFMLTGKTPTPEEKARVNEIEPQLAQLRAQIAAYEASNSGRKRCMGTANPDTEPAAVIQVHNGESANTIVISCPGQ